MNLINFTFVHGKFVTEAKLIDINRKFNLGLHFSEDAENHNGGTLYIHDEHIIVQNGEIFLSNDATIFDGASNIPLSDFHPYAVIDLVIYPCSNEEIIKLLGKV